jgi:nitrous oxide reductase
MPMSPQIGVSYLPINSRRQRSARRRIVLIAALAALAGASAVTGALVRTAEDATAPAATLPYS